MPVAKLQSTPAQRAQSDRVARGRPRMLARAWRGAAERFAAEHGVKVEHVLDVLDEIASVYLYGGDNWPDAQARGWFDTVALLTPRSAS